MQAAVVQHSTGGRGAGCWGPVPSCTVPEGVMQAAVVKAPVGVMQAAGARSRQL